MATGDVRIHSRSTQLWRTLLLMAGAAVFFHGAYSTRYSFLIFGYVICLVRLGMLLKGRFAFYGGLLTGFLCVAPQLRFFWGIFGMPAIPFWAILAFWIASFIVLSQMSFVRLGPVRTILLAPFLWTGLEYFRSELYPLRFAWLNLGYSLSDISQYVAFHWLGVYGIGFVLVFLASCIVVAKRFAWLLVGTIVFVILGLIPHESHMPPKPHRLQVAGVQAEFPSEDEVISNLDKVAIQCPEAQLIVLSEYTFDVPVPPRVRRWCREHRKYLIVGGEDPISSEKFYNTTFVIAPDGEVVFKQAKCVPVQFFIDGSPAPDQHVWDSPWGKLGICICYDLSYTRVTDQLVKLGATAIIVPTMDVQNWGKHEHELHARVAPVRAAEYGIPIFRVASSGISQLVSSNGRVMASAPFDEQNSILSGEMTLDESPARLPLDRFLAPSAVGVTGCFILWLGVSSIFRKFRRSSLPMRSPVLSDQ